MTAEVSDAFAKIGPVMVGGSRVELTALSWVAMEVPSCKEARY
jgi:hypothetical protein